MWTVLETAFQNNADLYLLQMVLLEYKLHRQSYRHLGHKTEKIVVILNLPFQVADVELSSEDLTAEEKRILQRKLKKERKKEEKRLKREQGTTSVKTEVKKYSGAELSLEYLMRWSRNRSEWKFQKARQTWLLQHMYDTDKVPDEYFPVLLEYLEGLRGHARNTTVQKAEEIMREHEKCEVSVSPEKVQRAREILQMLS
ncbi:uncharacterized protein C7orf50 homolog [Protopterus annectens]|uniref:uncharacterized protein C7orf50 homolog n=1 Tax=Protopterus annectens TaxID=7888 RepID=UPI001CFB52D0|nr:uncharacterized protein C7orf50 homolog [Protopterus annectens]